MKDNSVSSLELSKFLKWVEDQTYFFQDKDVTIDQVVKAYLDIPATSSDQINFREEAKNLMDRFGFRGSMKLTDLTGALEHYHNLTAVSSPDKKVEDSETGKINLDWILGIEIEAKQALKDVEEIVMLCANEAEENIFFQGYYAAASKYKKAEPKRDKVDALTIQDQTAEQILNKWVKWNDDLENVADKIFFIKAMEEYGKLKWNQAAKEQLLLANKHCQKFHKHVLLEVPKPEFKP